MSEKNKSIPNEPTKINVPWQGIENWYLTRVPVEIQDNPYLIAYLKTKKDMLRWTAVLLFLLGMMIGMRYRLP